uniref:Uncharacterized protein n=1 Tax=Rhizophora mucronata TaxID=61149 RepID=A0A2P2NY19_RHIMU
MTLKHDFLTRSKSYISFYAIFGYEWTSLVFQLGSRLLLLIR